MRPDAHPGLAASPSAKTFQESIPPPRDVNVGRRNVGWMTCSMCSTLTYFATASLGEIRLFFSTRSVAILSAAIPVRLPTRHCKIYNTLSSTVNSTSIMFLYAFSRTSQASFNSSKASPNPNFAISSICSGVRIPATTSSPCEDCNHSP